METSVKIFLSYGSYHQAHADFLQKKLRELFSSNLDLFVAGSPDGIRPAENWKESVLGELRNAKVLLVLLSPASATRPWVSFEIGAALALNKCVYPLRYASLCDHDLPSTISHLQSLDLRNADVVNTLIRLIHPDKQPKEESAQKVSSEIAEYFKTIPSDDWVRLYTQSPRVRLRFLGNLSVKQYKLFHIVSSLEWTNRSIGCGLVTRSMIMDKISNSADWPDFNPESKNGLTDSELYYRLRELYFLGLLDNIIVSEPEQSQWRVCPDIRRELFNEDRIEFGDIVTTNNKKINQDCNNVNH